MSSEPFRFLHAAGFRLDQPLEGVLSGVGEEIEDAPAALRELLIDAPYRAAKRVFEAALSHAVDFVVLSGDLLDLDQFDPRAVSFYIEQFQRLAEKKISVFWAGAALDSPERWPSFAPLPENVRFFSHEQPESIVFQRGAVAGPAAGATSGVALAVIAGLSSPATKKPRSLTLQGDAQGRFTIAVLQSDEPPDQLTKRKMHYWALGGGAKSTVQQPGCTIHDPGPVQGRSVAEIGACGCTLVEVDAQKKVKLQSIPTDEVRWRQERVLVPSGATRKDLERSLRERAAELAAAEKRALLVEWIVEAPATLRGIWGATGLAEELLQLLRREFGSASPLLYSVSLAFAPAGELPAAWYQEDTLLGDFLREVRLRQHKPTGAEKEITLPAGWSAADLVEPSGGAYAGALVGAAADERAWRDAVLLGLEILRGEAEAPV